MFAKFVRVGCVIPETESCFLGSSTVAFVCLLPELSILRELP